MTMLRSKTNLPLIPNKVISFGARAVFAKLEWASPALGLEKVAELAWSTSIYQMFK